MLTNHQFSDNRIMTENMPKWGSWNYSGKYLPRSFHSSKTMNDLIHWLQSNPHVTMEKMVASRRQISTICLVIGLAVREIGLVLSAQMEDEHDESLPSWIIESSLGIPDLHSIWDECERILDWLEDFEDEEVKKTVVESRKVSGDGGEAGPSGRHGNEGEGAQKKEKAKKNPKKRKAVERKEDIEDGEESERAEDGKRRSKRVKTVAFEKQGPPAQKKPKGRFDCIGWT